tara:strand:- start:142 stop:726 length:585 start_codon:yes stop_codon:yes gene_type:complete
MQSRRKCHALSIVYLTAQRYTKKAPPHFFDEDHFINLGKEVLMKAREKYDQNQKTKFTTFLITCLNNAFKTALKNAYNKHRNHFIKKDSVEDIPENLIKLTYPDITTLPSKTPLLEDEVIEKLDLQTFLKLLYKKMSSESIEVLEHILNAPSELVELGYTGTLGLRKILKFKQISRMRFNLLKQEVRQIKGRYL